jgi:hypothetical protein
MERKGNKQMAGKKKVLVVVNKYWECDPVCSVLTSKYINDQPNHDPCNIDLKFTSTFKNSTYPSYGPVKPPAAEQTVPRMIFETESRIIEIWCISDLLSNSPANQQSSSEEKMKLLPIIFNYLNDGQKLDVELVVAVGTASSGPSAAINPTFNTDNINGSVVIGSKVFLYNGWDIKSKSNFQCSNCWGEIFSSGTNEFWQTLQKMDFSPYEKLLLCSPTNPSPLKQHVYVNENYIGLGDVNVTDYTKYAQKDLEAGQKFFAKYPRNVDGVSLETTHCLIYLTARNFNKGQDPPFLFVSGIVDRYTKYNDDVKPKAYAQNTSGAHNAGIAVACIISQLVE